MHADQSTGFEDGELTINFYYYRSEALEKTDVLLFLNPVLTFF